MLFKDVIKRVRQNLKESGSGGFRPATGQNFKLAEEAGFPRELIDFYRSFEPYGPNGHGVFDPDQHIHIWDIHNALWSIRKDVPARPDNGEGNTDREETRAGTRTSPTNEHLIRSTGVLEHVAREVRKYAGAYGKSVNPAAKKGTVKSPTTATAQ